MPLTENCLVPEAVERRKAGLAGVTNVVRAEAEPAADEPDVCIWPGVKLVVREAQ